MCLSHVIYIVRPCLIHTCRAMPMPCSDHTFLKATAQHGRRETAVPCCGLKNSMVGAWHGRGMASVNQTRPHCVNQMGKTHSKHLAARNGRGKAWARHDMCESAFNSFCILKRYVMQRRSFCCTRYIAWNVITFFCSWCYLQSTAGDSEEYCGHLISF